MLLDPMTLPLARFRSSAEDFVVEELPADGPSGTGEHLFVTFRKEGLTTEQAVRALGEAMGVDVRGAGYAGMKDRHAVTTQAATFPLPMARDAAEAMQRCAGISGITVLDFARHGNKLKPGHLNGNRFRITLRDLDAGARDSVREALLVAGREGVPNAFGPQRFGRDGDNPARALAFLSGRERGPRDKRIARLLFSSVQSLLFNQVLERREHEGSWTKVLPGDVAKKVDSGGLFDVPLEGDELADAEARATAGLIAATGPMFGPKMRWPQGKPRELEHAVLSETLGDASVLEGLGHLGEGTRRPLRLPVAELSTADVEGGLVVSFVLPKGGYATTVLGRACRLIDASRRNGGDANEEEKGEATGSVAS